MTTYWHPFADMAKVSTDGELVIATGDGAYVHDEAGRKYFDAAAGLWYCNVGYGRTELVEAAAHQMSQLSAYSNFGPYATRPTLELADRLAELAPFDGAKIFFTSGGSDSIDTAVKLALRYWAERGQPERNVIIVRDKAYHGMHMAGTSMAGIQDNRSGYSSLLPQVEQVAHDDADDLAATIERVGPERVAAFFCEPVIGAGGVFPVPETYLTAARRTCRDNGVLFVADEVICGFGRLGEWFASGRFGLSPDMITCAKGLTSGYLPMGAVVIDGSVAEPFFARPGTTWRHGYTYSGHATAAAVALANLDLMAREDLLARARELEGDLAATLTPLARHDLVADVRCGVGVLAAVQLAASALAERPDLPDRTVGELRRRGVLTRVLTGGALQVSPSLVTEGHDLKLLAEAVTDSLDALATA